MTTFRICSDLHFEFHRDGGEAFADELSGGASFDALICAGDLASAGCLQKSLHFLCAPAKPRPALYVLGNHESYGSSWEHTLRAAAEAMDVNDNLVVLERRTTRVLGHRIVGCSLWFQHSGKRQPLDRHMSDFKVISDLYRQMPELGRDSAEFLRRTVQAGDIVITHHMPHPRSVHAIYEGNALNRYFLNDVHDVVEGHGAALWVHGHTHESFDYVAGTTRVVCNPFGYTHELNKHFKSHFDVVVPEAAHAIDCDMDDDCVCEEAAGDVDA